MPSRSPLLLLPLLLLACGSSEKTCNLNLVEAALTVVVTDDANGSCLVGAAVTATDSRGRVVAINAPNGIGFPTPPCGHYLGLGDNDVQARSAWTITVMKGGYATVSVPITMDHDGCHVVGQSVAVKLTTTP